MEEIKGNINLQRFAGLPQPTAENFQRYLNCYQNAEQPDILKKISPLLANVFQHSASPLFKERGDFPYMRFAVVETSTGTIEQKQVVVLIIGKSGSALERERQLLSVRYLDIERGESTYIQFTVGASGRSSENECEGGENLSNKQIDNIRKDIFGSGGSFPVEYTPNLLLPIIEILEGLKNGKSVINQKLQDKITQDLIAQEGWKEQT